jgi:acetyl esterase/lipase
VSIVLLVLAVVFTVLAHNAWRALPRRGHGPVWILALVVGETAPQRVLGAGVVAAVFLVMGWAGGWAGTTGLLLIALGVVLLGVVHARALRARGILEAAASVVTGERVRLPGLPWARLLRPTAPLPSDVECERGLAYGPHPLHRVDRYRLIGHAAPAPAFVYVHGGGWTGGRMGRQARPLLHHLAELGWVVFEAGYRLSPKATFPDHLTDVKRAVAWLRETAAEHGVDPGFVAIGGGSAGGQLAALVALTAGDPGLQEGFEEADTSVQACVPFYGVHDLLAGDRPKWPYLASHVLKAAPADEPDLWRLGSPVRMATAVRPPFLVLHGELDALVRPTDSRRLVAALEEAGGPPVGHAELVGATHGFDSVSSVRGLRTAQAVAVVLDRLRAAARAEQA